jgi:type IV secretory pathway VirB2 component (pilin)
MNLTHLFPLQQINSLYLIVLQAAGGVPGEGLLNSIAQFITGPFGKAITLIAIVLCGVSYMYGKQSDNSSIGRLAIGAALIVGAANIFAYIQQAG